MSHEKSFRPPSYDDYDTTPSQQGKAAAARGRGTMGTSSIASGAFFAGAREFDINGGEFNQAARDMHKTVNNDHSNKSDFNNDYRESTHYRGQSAHHDYRGSRVQNARYDNDGLDEPGYGRGRGRGRRAFAQIESRFRTNYEQRPRSRPYYDDDDDSYDRDDDFDDDMTPQNRRDFKSERFRQSEYLSGFRGPDASDSFNAGRYNFERQRQDYGEKISRPASAATNQKTEKERLVSVFREWLDTKDDILTQKKADSQIFEEFMKDQQQDNLKYGKSSRVGAGGEKSEIDPKA